MSSKAPPTSDRRERLRQIIRTESVRTGEFVLSSGERSSYYVDLRRTTTNPEGAFLVADLLLDRLTSAGPLDAVGGPTLGADPIVGALAARSHERGSPLPGFIVRSAKKAHGTGKRIEGHMQSGWRVAVLDDVVTGGGSILGAVDAVREAGGEVAAVLTILDRNQGGRERLEAAGLTLISLFEVGDVVDAADG